MTKKKPAMRFLINLILFLVAGNFYSVRASEDELPRDECHAHFCSARQGYFTKKNLDYQNRKILYSREPTNFFIQIKNIKAWTPQQYYFQVCAVGASGCQYVRNADDQVLLYRNTHTIYIFVNPQVFQFSFQYAAGCDLVDGDDVEVVRQIGSSWTQPGYCWILIPKVDMNSATQQTAHSYAVIKDLNLGRDSTLFMYNLLTGEKIMNFNESNSAEDEEVAVSNIEPLDTSVTYQLNYKISSAVLLTVGYCSNEFFCKLIGFNLTLRALTKDDLDCTEMKQACYLGFESGAQCRGECPAYNQLLADLDEQYEDFDADSDEIEDEQDYGRFTHIRRKRGCLKWVGVERASPYCKRNKKARYIYRCSKVRCSAYCMFVRLRGKCRGINTSFA